jgi:hypothetical protein
MTDPADPIDPADRAWFRSHVEPVLDAEPVADAWAEVAARVRGGSSAPPSAAPSRARWVAAAATLVAFALVGFAVVATQGDDDGSATLRSSGDHPAGWYIPTGLPEGWQLQSAMATEGPPCDGASRRWKTRPEHAEDDGSRPAIELRFSSCGRLPDDPGVAGPTVGPDAAPSFVDPPAEDPSWEVVRWEDDGLWELTGEGISGSRLLEAADAVASNPAAASPLPELTVTGAGSGQEPRPGGRPGAALVMVSPTGQRLQYELVASGEGPQLTPFTNEVAHPVTEQPLPLRRRGAIEVDRLWGVGEMGTGYLYGTRPGADVGPKPGTNRPPTAAEARAATDALAGSLRPANTDDWRAFLATATEPVTDQALLTATSLSTIGNEPTTSPSSTTTTPGEPGPTTTTTEPPDDGPATSEPGVATPRPAPTGPDAEVNAMIYQGYTELDGLELRIELPTTLISPYTPTHATLIARNTTDQPVAVTECTQQLTSIGTVPADDPTRSVPSRFVTDCFGTERETIAPGATVRLTTKWLGTGGFVARHGAPHMGNRRFLGTLPGGDYLAVMKVPGRTSEVRIALPVRVAREPDGCAVSDAEVERWMFHRFDDEAVDQAKADGDTLVEANDDLAGPIDCNRLRADLYDGKIVGLVRG